MANPKRYQISPNGEVIINGNKTNKNKLYAMADNWTLKDMGEKFGVSHQLIKKCLFELGIKKHYVRYV